MALLGLILTGCASSGGRSGVDIRPVTMPEWSYTGEHPDYPSSEYVIAYGLARNSKDASEAAERRLEVLICDHAISPHQTLFKDTRFSDIVVEPAAWFQLGEFGNAIKADGVSNGFEAVAARAISKNELKLRALALLPAAQDALAAEPQPPRGLGSISKRMEMWGKYFLLSVRVVALELLASDTLNRTAFDKVEDSLMALWELPALVKTDTSGSGQHVRIHGGCDQPIELGAYFRGKPVAGAPLQWGPGPGFRGTIEGDAELDESGRATAKVLYLQPTGDDFGYVAARLDINRVVGRQTGIAMNVWLWQVKLPSRNTGELVLRINETEGGDQAVPEPMFAPEVRKWGEGRKLSTSIQKADDDKFSYHLLLEGDVDVTPTTDGEIPSAYVAGNFTLSDMETGEVLFRYALGLRRTGKPGNTEASVKLLAMQEGAAEVMSEFASRILVALPGPDEEFGRER
ncbi:MAG: hypothetical protein H6839_13485 [Planctomycetes bacterium]|nr:hypothetical protein [Planctomycetota bacterium]